MLDGIQKTSRRRDGLPIKSNLTKPCVASTRWIDCQSQHVPGSAFGSCFFRVFFSFFFVFSFLPFASFE